MDITSLRQLTPVKTFRTVGNSGAVHLLKGGKIVRKTYFGTRDPVHKENFWRELAMYRYAERHGFTKIPKLLGVDENQWTFYVSYAGKTPPKNAQNVARLKDCLKDLYQRTGLYYHKPDIPQWTLHWGNVCERDGEICLIDFGSRRWRCDPPAAAREWPETVTLLEALKRRAGDLAHSRRKIIALKKKDGKKN